MDPRSELANTSRRNFLTSAAGGVGGLALAALLAKDGVAATSSVAVNPLAAKPPHFAPRARRCIFFFFSGGTSHVDLFDPKPKLNELNGQPVPESLLKGARFAFIQKDSAVILGTPRKFRRHGQSGMAFSDLLPRTGAWADEICMVRSMHTDAFNHHPGTILMNSGFARMGRPTIGSWLTYGLGSESENLPGYVVLEPGPGIRGGATNWSHGFLPSTYAGVRFNLPTPAVGEKGEREPALRDLESPKGYSREVERLALDSLARLNEHRLGQVKDPEIAARIASYELAFRMQKAAPELLDLAGEKAATLEAYGANRAGAERDFSVACLLARRMVERGVRFVNVYMDGWDHHNQINAGLEANGKVVDQPLAYLLQDLKQRGLLDSTLVVWCTEFGRTPLGENRAGVNVVSGRDHHPFAFSLWMAGGGVRGGHIHGATDELGWNVADKPVHINDFHATLLHLFGLDHEALTYRFEGRDFRLTDVAGKVVREWLAT
ncbi:sulfatase [Planctomycetaceae bacterium SCGC AG-212-D15]|nr:sulfatase [Planctomycetaceae bacterium SCGC AG-212-D15]